MQTFRSQGKDFTSYTIHKINKKYADLEMSISANHGIMNIAFYKLQKYAIYLLITNRLK